MEKDLEHKVNMEKKREEAKENKCYSDLPQVQKNIIFMMGVGPHNENVKQEDVQPSEDKITILRAKTGIKVQNHLHFEMKEKGCLVELVLGFCKNLNNGNLTTSSSISDSTHGFSPF